MAGTNTRHSPGGENGLTKAHCNFELDVPVVALVVRPRIQTLEGVAGIEAD